MCGKSENQRLDQARAGVHPWKKWGPYLSERQWGTVREDYSGNGDAWNYFSHDQARSRAYRWGEDGLGGISDDHQLLCFALALWNGRDPILKERAFGLTNAEGNHGEDVKEYYYYLDSTPTHSYMKYLYKYPHAAFPYEELVKTNRARGRQDAEFELLDTGVFDEGRYFDVFVEYAKAASEDILIRISVFNRGPSAETLHVLPTLWFRNTWSGMPTDAKPQLEAALAAGGAMIRARYLQAPDWTPACMYLYCDAELPLLFTDNETNSARLFGSANASPYVKDGINDFVVHGSDAALNPCHRGTKAAAHYRMTLPGGQSKVIQLRLTNQPPAASFLPFAGFDEIFSGRIGEADAFYASITPLAIRDDAERVRVLRQALAGMLWTKQYFCYDVKQWLEEHGEPGQSRPGN